jgi:hypothetical protein
MSFPHDPFESFFQLWYFRYLYIGFRASPELVQRERVRSVWAILRIRHPFLASKIEMRDYNDVSFVCVVFQSSVTSISLFPVAMFRQILPEVHSMMPIMYCDFVQQVKMVCI